MFKSYSELISKIASEIVEEAVKTAEEEECAEDNKEEVNEEETKKEETNDDQKEASEVGEEIEVEAEEYDPVMEKIASKLGIGQKIVNGVKEYGKVVSGKAANEAKAGFTTKALKETAKGTGEYADEAKAILGKVKQERAKQIGAIGGTAAGVAVPTAAAIAVKKAKAQEKAAEYYENAQMIKQAAMQAIVEASMIEDAAIEVLAENGYFDEMEVEGTEE